MVGQRYDVNCHGDPVGHSVAQSAEASATLRELQCRRAMLDTHVAHCSASRNKFNDNVIYSVRPSRSLSERYAESHVARQSAYETHIYGEERRVHLRVALRLAIDRSVMTSASMNRAAGPL